MLRIPGFALIHVALFAIAANAQIAGLCNTGQTHVNPLGCTGQLVTPNPSGGGPNRDGNWELAFPYPTLQDVSAPCKLTSFVNAWVDSPFSGWLPNSASTGSEWSTPYDGESPVGEGWYVYRTRFHVPSVLPNGSVPRGVIIRGQLASDNAVYGIYLASPGLGGTCALVAGQPFPVNPPDHVGYTDFDQWWPFSFKDAGALSPGTDAFLYFAVENYYYSPGGGPSSQGLRVEFFDTSAFY